MTSNLKQLVCDPNCGFMVQSHDENEVVNVGMSHTKNMHNLNLSTSEVREMIKTV